MKNKSKILKLKSKKDFRELLLGFTQFDLGINLTKLNKLVYFNQIIKNKQRKQIDQIKKE